MKRYDVMEMTMKAGISDSHFDFQMVSPDDLLEFAKLVAAKERNRIASAVLSGIGCNWQEIAASIRALGDE